MLDENITAVVASRAVLRSLLYWTIREMENEIDARHGKMRVTAPETGISKVYLDERMLHFTDYRVIFTWNFLFQFLDAVWVFFVIDAVYYEFEAEVFVKGVYTLASATVAPVPDPESTGKFGYREGGYDDQEV